MESFTSQNQLLLCNICYYTTALLVLLPNTFGLRISLLPLTLYLACLGLTTFDAVKVFDNPGLNWMNFNYGVGMLTIAMKAVDWTFRREPLRRFPNAPAGSRSLWTLIKDTCDLVNNARGIGWTWSKNYKPPPHTRPTSSTPYFLFYALTSAITHFVIADCAHYIIQSTDWENFTNPHGASLYNSSLSPIPRYLLSSFNSALCGLIVYCGLQCQYDIVSVLFITLLGHSPLDWPPVFDSPWRATSITDFWSHRWHQLFRRSFIQMGVKPLTFIVGRESGIGLLGGFIISGLLHGLGMWNMGRAIDLPRVGGYFVIQGVGAVLETTILKKRFGGKVDGWKGWMWTMCWTIVWANLLFDAWCQRGLVASYFVPDMYRPSVVILDAIGYT